MYKNHEAMEGLEIPVYNYKKYVKIFGGMLAVSIIYGWILFPIIMKSSTTAMLRLKPGAKMREEMYMAIPLDISFKVFLFNVTNPEEVQAGAIPIMNEVGPYVFSERKFKYDPEDDEEHDTLSFNLRNTYYFDENATLPLTGKEILTIPHMVMMAGLIMTQRDSAPLLPMAIKGLSIVLRNPTYPFMTATAWEYLFDGYPINCDVDDFEAEAVCSALEEALGDSGKINDTHLGFSFFKAKNATDAGRFKVYRGIKKIDDIGRVIEYNDETELDVYDGEECNEFKGTDGLFFPPFLTKDMEIWAFASPICRSVATWFEEKTSYKGVALSRYVTHFNSSYDCFCRDSDRDNCPPDGTFDLSMCLSAPLIGSKPHFYDSDPDIFTKVKGLTPDKEAHDTRADFDLFAGTPVSAVQRLQFNLDMEPVDSYPPMENLPKTFVPIFWVEEEVKLNKTFVRLFKLIHGTVNVSKVIKLCGLVFGLVGLPISTYLMMNSPAYVEHEVNVVKEMDSGKNEANGPNIDDMTIIKNHRNKMLESFHVDASNKNLVMPPQLETIHSGREG